MYTNNELFINIIINMYYSSSENIYHKLPKPPRYTGI